VSAVPDIDIRPREWEIVSAILRRHLPATEVWAFGSRAVRTAKPYSDLDLAVIGAAPLSLGTLAALAEAFDESALPYKVDVVDWATASDAFKEIIRRQHVVLKPAPDAAGE
jgi:predicted nucleotidyltransferase